MDRNDLSDRWQKLRQQIEASWQDLSSSAQQRWDKLSEDDIAEIEGRVETLIEKIQERYGVAREEAERQVDDWGHKEIPGLGVPSEKPSLRWTFISLAVTIVAAIIAFTGLADLIELLAMVLFYVGALATVVFLVLAIALPKKDGGA